MARIKGTNLAHVRDFVERELGAEAAERMRRSLGPETGQAYDSFIASSWYPEQVFVDLLHALDGTLGQGDGGALLQRAGAYGAEFDVTKIHRVLFRLANPGFVLEKSMNIWHRFYDSGVWRITRPSDTSADGLLEGWGIVDAVSCEYLRAYLQRMFELVGATGVVARHPECRARVVHGHAPVKACRYVITWQ
jgi:hypothetical protein